VSLLAHLCPLIHHHCPLDPLFSCSALHTILPTSHQLEPSPRQHHIPPTSKIISTTPLTPVLPALIDPSATCFYQPPHQKNPLCSLATLSDSDNIISSRLHPASQLDPYTYILPPPLPSPPLPSPTNLNCSSRSLQGLLLLPPKPHPVSIMNGDVVKKATLNKVKQAVNNAASISASISPASTATNGNKKRRKDLKPIITAESPQGRGGGEATATNGRCVPTNFCLFLRFFLPAVFLHFTLPHHTRIPKSQSGALLGARIILLYLAHRFFPILTTGQSFNPKLPLALTYRLGFFSFFSFLNLFVVWKLFYIVVFVYL
jgi:hypothetical protein